MKEIFGIFIVLIVVVCLILYQYKILYDYIRLGCVESNKCARRTMAQFLQNVAEIRKQCSKNGNLVIILPLNFGDTDGLINMGTFRAKWPIVFKPVWGYYFSLNPEIFSIAFAQSIGHELGHWSDIKQGNGYRYRPKEEKELFAWACEIRNDFEGIKFVEKYYKNVSRNQILDAIREKANAPIIELKKTKKTKKTNKHEPTYRDHPDWSFRLQMLEYDDFTIDIISHVVEKVKCKNESYIQEITQSYFGR